MSFLGNLALEYLGVKRTPLNRSDVSSFGIRGHIKAVVKRGKTGLYEVHCDEENTIQAGFKSLLAGNLQANTNIDITMDNLYDGVIEIDTSTNGWDGIAVKVDSIWYSLNTVGSGLGWSGSGAARTLTGKITGRTGTIADADSVILGKCSYIPFNTNNFIFAPGGSAGTGNYAKPTSWSSLTLAASDELTIAWTITVA